MKLSFRLFFFLEVHCTAELGSVMMASALPRASSNLRKLPWALIRLTGEAEITWAKAPWPHPRVITLKFHLPGNIPTQGILHSAVSRRFMDVSLNRIA